MDVGKDIKQSRTLATKLSNTVQGMMNQWTEDQFPNFVETMDLIRQNAPLQYAKLYLEAVKLGVVKESNININFNRQQDRESLQALVSTRISLPEKNNYVAFEEVNQEPIPVQKEEESL